MTGSFGEDELFEDEWVEICDIEGRRMSMRHLATMRVGEKTYMLLEDGKEEAHGGALMLVREDRTVDGALEYVVSNDEQEIERVMGRFAAHLFEMGMADGLPEPDEWDGPGMEDETGAELEDIAMPDAEAQKDCGCEHPAWAFCYCGDPAYLQ